MISGKRNRLLKQIAWAVALLFILMNAVAYFHAYKFTHFSNRDTTKTKTAAKLTVAEKIGVLFFGIDNPRPENNAFPPQNFETIKLSGDAIECWSIRTGSTKGTVILFHGYGGQKSSLIDKSDEFIKAGYNTLLVDFMGSGGSKGNQTTIGYKEAMQVKACFYWLQSIHEERIFLFGTSLGAVAILKAINDYGINPAAIIIECPFGSMYKTTCARFRTMNAPTFPMAGLLVFWGGVQNGFWAFGHKPTEYAKAVKCPVLLLYGEKDEKVSREEINSIYANLRSPKILRTYANAAHENYLIRYKQQWVSDVAGFLNSITDSTHQVSYLL